MHNVNALKTQCKYGHPFDKENTYARHVNGRLRRECRTCKRALRKQWKPKHPRKGSSGLTRAQRSAQLFWARVPATEPGRCWIWGGRLDRWGYGKFGSGRLAHRVAYTLRFGEIPDGMTLDHLCRNTLCVNPDHLEPVTAGENARRAAQARADLKSACSTPSQ